MNMFFMLIRKPCWAQRKLDELPKPAPRTTAPALQNNSRAKSINIAKVSVDALCSHTDQRQLDEAGWTSNRLISPGLWHSAHLSTPLHLEGAASTQFLSSFPTLLAQWIWFSSYCSQRWEGGRGGIKVTAPPPKLFFVWNVLTTFIFMTKAIYVCGRRCKGADSPPFPPAFSLQSASRSHVAPVWPVT